MDLKIRIDDEVYNHFLNNKYSRADIMAVHTALNNAIPLCKGLQADMVIIDEFLTKEESEE